MTVLTRNHSVATCTCEAVEESTQNAAVTALPCSFSFIDVSLQQGSVLVASQGKEHLILSPFAGTAASAATASASTTERAKLCLCLRRPILPTPARVNICIEAALWFQGVQSFLH